MSDKKTRDQEIVSPGNGDQQEPSVSELVSIQRERDDTMRHALDVNEKSIQRRFEYNIKKLEADEQKDVRIHNLARTVILGGGSMTIVIAGLLLYMAFFGDQGQSATAIKLISEVARALGGAGFIFLLYLAFQRLLRR